MSDDEKKDPKKTKKPSFVTRDSKDKSTIKKTNNGNTGQPNSGKDEKTE